MVNEGGGAFCKTLYYPAVLYPVREGMKLYREEQFGPLDSGHVVRGREGRARVRRDIRPWAASQHLRIESRRKSASSWIRW